MGIPWKNILSHKITIKILSILIFLYLYLVYISSKKTVIYTQTLNKKSRPNIYAFWHNRLAMMPLFVQNRPMNALVSPHRDGLIISDFIKLFGIKTIAGSTNRNALSALRTMQTKIKLKEHTMITPDGPRGPIYQINSNIVKIASKNRTTIVPTTYSAARTKIFRSWDKFILPLPFNKLVFIHGNPIHGRKLSKVGLKRELDRISNIADNLVHQKSCC